MANKIRFSSLAQQELEDASEWYEEQLLGLGESFSDKVYEAANIISNNPDLYQQRKSKFYECVIYDFPYIVVYEYLKKESVVNILHIFIQAVIISSNTKEVDKTVKYKLNEFRSKSGRLSFNSAVLKGSPVPVGLKADALAHGCKVQ